jgi:DNA-3-methyladenine glycosylase II
MLFYRVASMSLRRSSRISTPLVNGNTKAAGSTMVSKKRPAVTEKVEAEAAKKPRKSASKKAASSDGLGQEIKKPSAPATPLRKSAAKSTKVPPLTPTSSLTDVIRAPYRTGDVGDAAPPPLDRPVDPHVTNAPLVTPGGTQNVAYPNGLLESTPTKTGLPRPTATTGNLLEKACAHLVSVDPGLKPLIEKWQCPIFSATGLSEEIDPFRSLSTGIIGQQVSGAAAKSIRNKFVAMFNDPNNPCPRFPTPAQVANEDIPKLRTAGLSQRKAEYIKGLAEKFVSGELTTDILMKATDEEVMEKLIAVRGLGKWSVEMFSCFGLKRMDILSTGDLGVQRGMAAYFGKDVKKLKAKGGGKWKYMSEQDMLEKSTIYAPYRSLFMWYMWKAEDVNIDVMQEAE